MPTNEDKTIYNGSKAVLKINGETIGEYTNVSVVPDYSYNNSTIHSISIGDLTTGLNPYFFTQPPVPSTLSLYSVFILNFLQLYRTSFLITKSEWPSVITNLAIIAFPDAVSALPICMPEIIKFINDDQLSIDWMNEIQYDYHVGRALFGSTKLYLDVTKTTFLVKEGLEDLAKVKLGLVKEPTIEKLHEEFKKVNVFEPVLLTTK